MNKMISLLTVVAFMLLNCLSAAAQDKPGMADAMRSNGKIYVVVAVCLTILIGLFIYVAAVDRKVRKIERKN